MRILSFLIIFVMLFFLKRQTDPPHGADFKISCNTCHSSNGWQLDKKVYSFDHNTTKLPLVGQHTELNCRLCHPTLVFSDAKTECNECHSDVHQTTVGLDCSRCHTPVSWLVNNINEIHQMSRFPLLGAHRTTDCYVCHKSESLARFDVPGVNCLDCHRQNYMSTTSPNHIQAGFSEDCSTCHPVTAFQWAGAGFNHNFFALVKGHATAICADCHSNPSDYSLFTCINCHEHNKTSMDNKHRGENGYSYDSASCFRCHPRGNAD